MLYGDQTVLDKESVMNVNLGGTATNFSSSGGFSNYFPQPDYQKKAVAEYFEIADLTYPYYSEFEVDFNTTRGLYNRIGRGYPDVSANGAQYRAYTGGEDYHWYGSSLASPLFASVLTLVNFLRSLQNVSTNLCQDQRGTLRHRQRSYWIRESCSVRQSMGFERYHQRHKLGLWLSGLPRCSRLGPGYRLGHAQLSQNARILPHIAMRKHQVNERTTSKSLRKVSLAVRITRKQYIIKFHCPV